MEVFVATRKNLELQRGDVEFVLQAKPQTEDELEAFLRHVMETVSLRNGVVPQKMRCLGCQANQVRGTNLTVTLDSDQACYKGGNFYPGGMYQAWLECVSGSNYLLTAPDEPERVLRAGLLPCKDGVTFTFDP